MMMMMMLLQFPTATWNISLAPTIAVARQPSFFFYASDTVTAELFGRRIGSRSGQTHRTFDNATPRRLLYQPTQIRVAAPCLK
jgi:hypothetical protein